MKDQIADVWERVVRAELPALTSLERATLIDHLPEFLDGLADWVDGDTHAARVSFETLAEGHALQRLELGVDLTTLTREYQLLRSTVLQHLLTVPSSQDIRESLLRVNEGLDEAVYAGVRRYTTMRDRVRDRFVGILAHDLRNPLSAITMAAATMATPAAGSTDALERTRAAIARSAERMARMIDDVMEFARGQLGGAMPTQLVPGDLGEIAREAVDELHRAHPTRPMTYAGHGDLSGYWDRDRVIQAISNLVSNAVQHGDGPIDVEVREADDRHSLILTVRNAGPVIAAERVSHLFDPIRLETPAMRRGLGLGLYIVRQIALAHGARCEVESTPERGTIFSVIWPRTPPDEVSSRS